MPSSVITSRGRPRRSQYCYSTSQGEKLRPRLLCNQHFPVQTESFPSLVTENIHHTKYGYGKAKLAPPLMPKQAMMAGSGRQYAFCLFVCYDGWRGVVGWNTVRENGAHQRALRTKHFVKLFNPACLQKEAPCFYFVFSGPPECVSWKRVVQHENVHFLVPPYGCSIISSRTIANIHTRRRRKRKMHSRNREKPFSKGRKKAPENVRNCAKRDKK